MALWAQPLCAEAHNNLGVLHREAGAVERAVACYQAALNARPNFPQARRVCVGCVGGVLKCVLQVRACMLRACE